MLFFVGIVLLFLLAYYLSGWASNGGSASGYNMSGKRKEQLTRKLYCETCRRYCDIDESGWCHECERISPLISS
jgi:hypothetical protein